MPLDPEIEITIDDDGVVCAHVNGAEGPACLTDLQAFEALLGQSTQTTRKPEFYKAQSKTLNQVRGGRG